MDSLLHLMYKLWQCAKQHCHRHHGIADLGKVSEGVRFVTWRGPSIPRLSPSLILCFAPELTVRALYE